MVKIEFLGPIGKEPILLDVKNLNDVSKELNKDENISIWLEKSAVALNDMIVNSLDIELKDGDKISILPPVCGG
ncbi:MAG: MoaD/ThiS family protein [Sulfurovaceae bacterium]|nr:MoaD/ThiS family protein [Sulfurovaceae bacterium]MDD5548716.1 MoaD/ThiS family protein [Sulfurovaceae bacterium]